MDGIYQAINKIAKYPIKLISYQLSSAKGHGNEALGQVDIVVECFCRRFHGIGLETDIVESSAIAMINVLNNIWRAELVKKQKNHSNTEVVQ
ncbi:2-isopropylmalate synthase [Arsenophonus endosymbiont of Bemisia tabaci Q2]|nr:2-isopropylmalate synthase [Arsenophonus endosymbiont of Bemisia tabaci Q2]